MKRQIRIKDIAEKAGVSTGTVDRVIHDRGNVSLVVKDRILAVMKELNYTPNIIASALAYNRTIRIATFLPNYDLDPFWGEPWKGALQAIEKVQHYGFVLESYFFDQYDPESFSEKANKLVENPPDAILIAPIWQQQAFALLNHPNIAGVPYVLINTNLRDTKALCYIGQDSYQSGVLAGRVLNFGLNRNETVVIMHLEIGVQNAQHLVRKEEGFRNYFKTKGKQDINVIKVQFEQFDNPGLLRDSIQELLVQHPEIRGIFVSTSKAYKVAQSLSDEQLKDIKIVGFDLIEPNLNYLRENKVHFLINQHPVQQGYLGIINLFNHLVLKKKIESKQYLPLDIVVIENAKYYEENEFELEVI
ncbi:MAG: substrate-binding domain-containing protein [Bacteroidetes bacterium]|nr:substrate-binding domain-containing protein [Bacteroidota bacterium]